MEITRTSILTGVKRTRDIPDVTEEKINEWRGSDGNPGQPIQNVFPDMSPDDREFLMTGIVPEEWDKMFEDKPKTSADPTVQRATRRR